MLLLPGEDWTPAEDWNVETISIENNDKNIDYFKNIYKYA